MAGKSSNEIVTLSRTLKDVFTDLGKVFPGLMLQYSIAGKSASLQPEWETVRTFNIRTSTTVRPLRIEHNPDTGDYALQIHDGKNPAGTDFGSCRILIPAEKVGTPSAWEIDAKAAGRQPRGTAFLMDNQNGSTDNKAVRFMTYMLMPDILENALAQVARHASSTKPRGQAPHRN